MKTGEPKRTEGGRHLHLDLRDGCCVVEVAVVADPGATPAQELSEVESAWEEEASESRSMLS